MKMMNLKWICEASGSVTLADFFRKRGIFYDKKRKRTGTPFLPDGINRAGGCRDFTGLYQNGV